MRITRKHAKAGAAIGAGLAVVITAVVLVPEPQVESHGNGAQPAARPSTHAPASSPLSSHRTTTRAQVPTPFVPTTTRSVVTTSAPPPRSSAPVHKPADEGFSWLPWGPADPGDPPPYQWYGMLQKGQCRGSSGKPALWEALEAVCTAAIDGDVTRWAAAGRIDIPAPNGCLERAAHTVLRDALAWHARNPAVRPKVRMASAGDLTACRFQLLSAELAQTFNCDGKPKPPLRGPVGGGTSIVLCVSNIDTRNVVVWLGGVAANVERAHPGWLSITTPAAAGPGAVPIEVVTTSGRAVAGERFEYHDEPDQGS